MKLSYLYNILLFNLKRSILIQYALKIFISYGKCLFTDLHEYLAIKRESVLIKFKNHKTNKTCIFFSWSTFSAIRFELGYVQAMELAGYEVIIVCSPEIPVIKFWKSKGLKRVYNINEISIIPSYNEYQQNCNKIENFNDIDKLKFNGVKFGSYLSATIMRQMQIMSLNLKDPKSKKLVDKYIFKSLSIIKGFINLNDQLNPKLIYMMDQNYSPRGEIFEFFINNNGTIITSNTAYISNHFILKKYTKENKYEHPNGISHENWLRAKKQIWNESKWQILKNELHNCYSNGSWYSSASTSVNSVTKNSEVLINNLNLDTKKKTAVIFSHIFWDATFFWGEDLFTDYEEWLIETVKLAALNNHVNWIIKIHPSNLIRVNKNIILNKQFSELKAIEKTLGVIPNNINILFPDSKISTYSLLNTADYCITVRGTPGMECAAFGIKTLTAGTGRFANKGFTEDSSNINIYIEKIKNIQKLQKMSKKQILDARKFLYMSLFDKKFKLSFVKHNYITINNKVTEITKIILDKNKKLEEYEEIKSISKWLLDDNEDFLIRDYL